jgi:hypothetical protein
LPYVSQDAGSSSDDTTAINKDLEEKLVSLKRDVQKNEKEVRCVAHSSRPFLF